MYIRYWCRSRFYNRSNRWPPLPIRRYYNLCLGPLQWAKFNTFALSFFAHGEYCKGFRRHSSVLRDRERYHLVRLPVTTFIVCPEEWNNSENHSTTRHSGLQWFREELYYFAYRSQNKRERGDDSRLIKLKCC